MNNKTTTGIILATYFLIICLACLGWVLNIISLVQATEIAGMEVARMFGIVIPFLGSVLGYF